ncbi:MAG TPA: hypothetical protein VFQ00_09045 [Terriglobales bacterium]|nr:hypothetical protein [Terriglobales bacterium]
MIAEFKDQQRSRSRLLWHYTLEQLQEVERIRAGDKVIFHIYARLTVEAIWTSPNHAAAVNFEIDTPGRRGGWPLQVEIAESDWIALLSQIKFRHPVLDRVPWPSLPPRFRRAEDHLNDAWRYLRTKEPAASLSSCYKAFECLGFDLFGKEVERKDVLDLLMSGAEAEKQQSVLAILRSLQNYFQLGRHEKRAPVHLSQADAQMAVVCTSTILAYLAPDERHQQRGA